MRKLLIAIAIAIGLLAGSASTASATTAATAPELPALYNLGGAPYAATAAVTLKPAVGPPTAKVTVTGSGYQAAETVILTFGTIQVAHVTAGSSGSFTASFSVPNTALPGSYPVDAAGQSSSLSATATFL